jgi:hypothetical protein
MEILYAVLGFLLVVIRAAAQFVGGYGVLVALILGLLALAVASSADARAQALEKKVEELEEKLEELEALVEPVPEPDPIEEEIARRGWLEPKEEKDDAP